ncbi:aminotransferase class V-fold PLP-dependent enzyme [Candidatus Woesearchaeota archaeon]|nr:aminotransferase class V-fold PLP-dependent enzyme [Candidatus Woesearchaeota archaeon]
MKKYTYYKEKLQAWKARFKSQLVSNSYKFNPWLAEKIKEQIKIEAKVKFFQNYLADLTAAPDTDGQKPFPPQTTNEGLEIIKQARELLGASYGLSGENIVCFLSSASGAAEAVLSTCANLLDSKRKILAANFGAFSERTARQAASLGLPLNIVRLPYGSAPLFENIVKQLDSHTHLITFPHLETGTAQELQPQDLIPKLADYCRRKKITPPIIAIDATSSKGTIDFQNYEEIPLIVYSGTLKTCGSPLMSFLAANDKALEKIISLRWEYHQKKYSLPYYFDLVREFSFQSPDKFFTLAADNINLPEDELKLKLKSLNFCSTHKERFSLTLEIWAFKHLTFSLMAPSLANHPCSMHMSYQKVLMEKN